MAVVVVDDFVVVVVVFVDVVVVVVDVELEAVVVDGLKIVKVYFVEPFSLFCF